MNNISDKVNPSLKSVSTNNLIKPKSPTAQGFTVGELLLIIIFTCVLTVLIIPKIIKARETATQKSTMADMVKWANAINSYIKDYSKAPANPRGELSYKKEVIDDLFPYIHGLSIVDWWGYPYSVWIGKGNNIYGIPIDEDYDFIIVSYGRNGSIDSWRFTPQNLESGLYYTKKISDFEKDIIFWNNRFIRGPKKKE